MSDAAIPVTLAGKVYHLRYTYPDFKLMEKTLLMKYEHFTESEIFGSMTAQEVYLWTGLKKEDGDRWVHVFPQTTEGQAQSGELLWEHLRETGNIGPIIIAVFDAFTTTGPWKKADPKPSGTKEKKPPKNSKT